MKLKDWMAFNQPFMACDFKIKLFRNKSVKQDDIMLETVVRWDDCEKVFGNYTITRLKIDTYPGTDLACFCLLLQDDDDKEEV